MLKKIAQKITLNRLLTYFVLLGFVPIIFAFFHFAKKKKEWDAVLQNILSVEHLAANICRKQALNTTVRTVFAEADPFYLEKQLESLSFLKKEKEALEQLFKSSTYTGNEIAEKRYAYLTSQANRLEWLQGSSLTSEGIQQIEIFLAHPVEIDAYDLKEILTRVEGNRKGKPQLVFTDFKLNKKEHLSGNEVFELNVKLLKREFMP